MNFMVISWRFHMISAYSVARTCNGFTDLPGKGSRNGGFYLSQFTVEQLKA